jgi:uridine phosphorylase
MVIKASELILNPDGSVYHLNLKPENISDTIIFVGDQDRVQQVTKHFSSIEFETQKREFKTQTGICNGKRVTVISTGIGTDNIDIVLNELDALANIELKTRTIKDTHTSLNIIRIGTSGSIQKDIPLDAFVMSSHGIDFSGLFHWYQSESIGNMDLENAFIEHTSWNQNKSKPIIIENSLTLDKQFEDITTYKGITATANGFYGPQGRVLRLKIQDADLNDKLESFIQNNLRITNLEMETAAIYGLSKLLGHQAISLNAIIANRPLGTFSKNPKETVEQLILYTLERL